MKEKVLEYKGNIYKHGDFIVGYIDSKFYIGKLSIENNNYYFCQDIEPGVNCSNKFGYNYSWIFSLSTNKLTDSVKIINNIKENDNFSYLKEENINNTNLYKNLFLLTDKLVNNKVVNVKSFEICRIMNHPDCCGSQILYNFCPSPNLSYSRYKDLKESDYNTIKKSLCTINEAAKIAHIASFQKLSIKFLEKLGFKEKYSYKNPKSGNKIHVYHYLN